MKCFEWAKKNAVLRKYHDEEWGVFNSDEDKLFESMVLEIFASGLNWSLILQRREIIKGAFAYFNAAVVAKYTDADIERILELPGMIRNRPKIMAVINNAQVLTGNELGAPSLNSLVCEIINEIKVSKISDTSIRNVRNLKIASAFASKLRKFGIKFMGNRNTYSFLQAIGVFNDHDYGCSKYQKKEFI